jgi:hypothetical protein
MDIEKAREIRSSQLWEEICTELDFWIRSEELKLRACVPEQLIEIQQVIETLEKVKSLPTIVIDREE